MFKAANRIIGNPIGLAEGGLLDAQTSAEQKKGTGQMYISVNTDVHCMDGFFGRSTYVILNPITKEVSHLVVREDEAPHTERLVPVRLVKETTPDLILLDCDRHKLALLRPFIETEFLQTRLPEVDYGADQYMIAPLIAPVMERVVLEQKFKAIPPGELAVHRGAHVEAADGRVGRVDEFVVEPGSGHITHLLLREGHLWGDEEVTIPVSEIAEIEADVVHLKLTKKQIEALPTIKVERAWL
jgi:sporulation protein YlmC with PRC-barrel domain